MNWVKNTFFTALMVIVATSATAAVVALVTCALASMTPQTSPNPYALYLIPVAAVVATVVGGFYSVVSLVVAAVTMPPAIGLIRLFKLPRPLFDIFGGGAAGLICVGPFMALIESIERAKGGNMSAEIQPALDICAMFGGAALAYVRHAMLVRARPPQEPASPLQASEAQPAV